MSGTQRVDLGTIKSQPIEQLIPYVRNARTHDDAQIAQIAGSIREFGFNNPVLIDSDNNIIAGHGRILAARKLGMTEAPCVVLDHMTPEQKRAYVIADNQIALNAGWNTDLLSLEMVELDKADFNLSLLGFSQMELMEHLGDVPFMPGSEQDQGQLDQLDPKWVSCPHCGERFDQREHE